ncbi:MAG: glycosyltransferase family 4 protein [Patescibacteria group bacterium]
MNLELFKNIFFLPFLVSFFISFISTPIVIKIAWRVGLVEDPQKKKHPKVIHTYPVPRSGGIPILLALLGASFLFLNLDKHLVGILAGATLAVIIGTLDDKYDLHPILRLFTGFLAASLVVGAGVGIAFISNPFNGIIHLDQPRIYFELFGKTRSIWILSDIFALFWIVWCMNMVNWSSGLDGQLSGIVPIAAVTIAILSFRFTEDITQWNVAILAAATAGAYLGFLPFHLYPQKIMPGYGGATLAGFLLATLAILSGAKVATAILVLGLPLTDGVYTIIRRIAQGRSPFWGDRGHLHHRLLDLGLSKRKVAAIYWLVTALLGIIALNLNSKQKFYTIVMLGVLVGGFLLWLTYLRTWHGRQDQDSG